MKKILLSALLLSCAFLAKAQDIQPIPASGKLYVGTNYQYHAKDSTRSFGIFGIEKDVYKEAMLRWLGKPVENTNGTIIWKNIKVEGLGNDLQVKISDGLLTHDSVTRSACFTPFKSDKDKQQKMVNIRSNQDRRMEISFLSKDDTNPVNNLTLEKACIAFLRNAYE